jgi:hypothetical protein
MSVGDRILTEEMFSLLPFKSRFKYLHILPVTLWMENRANWSLGKFHLLNILTAVVISSIISGVYYTYSVGPR